MLDGHGRRRRGRYRRYDDHRSGARIGCRTCARRCAEQERRQNMACRRAPWWRWTSTVPSRPWSAAGDYTDSQFDRAVSAKRQPGSAFKPFVYLSAIEKGLTPDTVRDDAPINVKGWQPENYSREYFGPGDADQGLVALAQYRGGQARPRGRAEDRHQDGRIGSASPRKLQPNASIALGTSEVTPLELVAAYTPFANGGVGVQPHIITRVKTAAGKLLYQRKASSFGRVIDPQNVGMMNAMMEETLLTGTARKAETAGLAGGGQDGNQPGLARRLVRRLHQPSRGRRSGSAMMMARLQKKPPAVICRSMSGAAS